MTPTNVSTWKDDEIGAFGAKDRCRCRCAANKNMWFVLALEKAHGERVSLTPHSELSCVCMQMCSVCKRAGLWVEWSAPLKPDRIFQSRAAERLIAACWMFHSKASATETVLQWVGHAEATGSGVFSHNKILKRLKHRLLSCISWSVSDAVLPWMAATTVFARVSTFPRSGLPSSCDLVQELENKD